jgi:S1-C subfamily serine protease
MTTTDNKPVAATAATLTAFSEELADVVEHVAPGVVRVDDGSRLTATGLIWREDGVIVTTSHGVERDDEVFVETHDGARIAATVAGRDDDTDVAVLRVAASGLPAVQTSGDVRVGSLVLALGRPGSWGLRATFGVVSARQETETAGHAEYILSTDAALPPGFSGGALVDTAGRVVGVTNRMFGRGSGTALGVSLVARVADALLSQGKVARGYLGVRTQMVALPPAVKNGVGAGREHGLLVVGLEPGGPAETGGLLLGDLVLGLNDQAVEDPETLRASLRNLTAGQSATLRLLRGGEPRDLALTLGTEA